MNKEDIEIHFDEEILSEVEKNVYWEDEDTDLYYTEDSFFTFCLKRLSIISEKVYHEYFANHFITEYISKYCQSFKNIDYIDIDSKSSFNDIHNLFKYILFLLSPSQKKNILSTFQKIIPTEITYKIHYRYVVHIFLLVMIALTLLGQWIYIFFDFSKTAFLLVSIVVLILYFYYVYYELQKNLFPFILKEKNENWNSKHRLLELFNLSTFLNYYTKIVASNQSRQFILIVRSDKFHKASNYQVQLADYLFSMIVDYSNLSIIIENSNSQFINRMLYNYQSAIQNKIPNYETILNQFNRNLLSCYS